MISFKNFLKERTRQAKLDAIKYPTHLTMRIPRKQMPQIKSTDVKDLSKWLRQQGIIFEVKSIQVSKIKPIQSEINRAKVLAMMETKTVKQLTDKPMIVSQEDFLMDGHHRWAALLNIGEQLKVDVFRIKLDITTLLSKIKEYDKTFSKGIHEAKHF